MKKQAGPLKVWQWGAIVGGGLGLYLLLHKKAATPEENETLGPLKAGLGGGPEGGGGGGSSEGGGLSGTPGPVGEPGPAGEPGAAGTPGRELTPAQETALNKVAEAQNNPPTIGSQKSSKPLVPNPFPYRNPKTGEHYKITTVKGKLAHLYHSGKVVVLAGKQAPSKAKAAKEIHAQAKKETRGSVRTPAAKPHGLTRAAPVASRSHAKPAPLRIGKPKAPVIHKPQGKAPVKKKKK